MYAKKSLGQNFLRDPAILKKIVAAAQITEADTVLEIGPGEGTLTQLLLAAAKKVISIEKDGVLAEKLKEKFKEEIEKGKLVVVEGDALEISPRNFLGEEESYVLVGNIPYYITGALFQKFLELQEGEQPKSLTFVVQKEVAERIVSRDERGSILSISIKAYGEPVYGGLIKAGSFSPAPQVDSAILSIRNISKAHFLNNGVSEGVFFETLKKGFAHKRKFLIRNLEEAEGFSKESLAQGFESLRLSKVIRAEEVTLGEWFDIIKVCHQGKSSPS